MALENVNGDRPSNETNDEVEYLFTRGEYLPFMPFGITTFFKNLKALLYQSTSLNNISAEDLKPFPRLEFLDLFDNNLTWIHGNLFSFTPLLKYISLDSNNIKYIGQDLVTNLIDLEYLLLRENSCINSFATNHTIVEELAPQLSVLCTPQSETSTEEPIQQCTCYEEIGELRNENQQQNEDIVQLQLKNDQLNQANTELIGLNSAVEKRLLDVEMKLREISSTPCVY